MEILTKKSTIQQVNGDVPEGGQLCIAIKKQALMGFRHSKVSDLESNANDRLPSESNSGSVVKLSTPATRLPRQYRVARAAVSRWSHYALARCVGTGLDRGRNHCGARVMDPV